MGNAKVNGVEYKIYAAKPSSKHLVNNKLFEMILPQTCQDNANDESAANEAVKKKYEQLY